MFCLAVFLRLRRIRSGQVALFFLLNCSSAIVCLTVIVCITVRQRGWRFANLQRNQGSFVHWPMSCMLLRMLLCFNFIIRRKIACWTAPASVGKGKSNHYKDYDQDSIDHEALLSLRNVPTISIEETQQESKGKSLQSVDLSSILTLRQLFSSIRLPRGMEPNNYCFTSLSLSVKIRIGKRLPRVCYRAYAENMRIENRRRP